MERVLPGSVSGDPVRALGEGEAAVGIEGDGAGTEEAEVQAADSAAVTSSAMTRRTGRLPPLFYRIGSWFLE